jgi:leader peptidase (prepilin peptidase)/N-methyltransferase
VSGLLDVGCALAGGLSGAAFYDLAARVPPAPRGQSELPLEPISAVEVEGESVELEPPGVEASVGEVRAELAPPPASLVGRLCTAAVTAVLFLGAAIHFGPVPELAPYCVLFCGLVVLSVTDIRVGLVPRKLLYPWLALVTVGLVGASAADAEWHRFVIAAVSGAVVFALFFAVWFALPRGMGFGDVRLAGVIALALGWLGALHVYVGLLVAFVAGSLWGVVAMLVTGGGRKTRIAFAPALAIGAVVGVLWGGSIINAWVGHGS